MEMKGEMHQVLLVIGANQGDRLASFRRCRLLFSILAGEVVMRSPIYDSSPWGVTDQPSFINQGILLHTNLTPSQLVNITQEIEVRLGKNKQTHWGPRHLDIDIILFDQEVITSESLTIPHPHMADRRFVLIPLAAIAEKWIHPISKLTIAEMLNLCQDNGEVRQIDDL